MNLNCTKSDENVALSFSIGSVANVIIGPMITRMMIHSVVFTIAIAISAVALNGAGMLNASLPGNSSWFTFGNSHDGDFGKRSWGHDDD